MTKDEALELLETAPTGNMPSKLNPGMTQAQAVKIIRAGVEDSPEGKLMSLMEKRVWQVVKNQRRPRY